MFNDRFLIIIVVGILLLIGVAFTLYALAPAPGGAEPADEGRANPGGAVHNYLRALSEQDYRKAYRYISSYLQCPPLSDEIFEKEVSVFPQDATWKITEARALTAAGDRLEITVNFTRTVPSFLFFTRKTTHWLKMEWRFQSESWRLVSVEGFNPFFSATFNNCWADCGLCKR